MCILQKIPFAVRTSVRKWIYQPIAYMMSSSSSQSPSPPKITSPRPSPEEIQAEKEQYLKMDSAEKRKLYKCKDNFFTLENILNWKDYFAKHNVEATMDDEQTYETKKELNAKVSVWEGDITTLEIDSIVNAANSSLLGGGGVDGAIHRAAGPTLKNECRLLNGCPEGEAKISGGYNLPAKHVIHTVGPQGPKPKILRQCYVNSLKLMVDNQLRSIAFPCISTGVYGYPNEPAANVALTAVREFMEENSDKVDRVIFTVFLEEDKAIYEDLMQKYFPLK